MNLFKILNEGFRQNNQSSIYLLRFSVTNNVNFQIFHSQYILPLNYYLKSKHDDSCPFCVDKERQTCKHFFYLCTYAQSFWNEFQSWWLLYIDVKSQLKFGGAVSTVVHVACGY